MNPVFLQYLTLFVHLDLVIYPTQATTQVRLLFRSHRILICNAYFKGGSSRILLIFRSMKSTGEFPALIGMGVFWQFTFSFQQFALFVYFNVLRSLLILRDFRDRGGGLINVIC